MMNYTLQYNLLLHYIYWTQRRKVLSKEEAADFKRTTIGKLDYLQNLENVQLQKVTDGLGGNILG